MYTLLTSGYLAVADNNLARPEKRSTLPIAIASCLRWPLLAVVIPRLCLIGFNYTQPFLISRIIDYVGQTGQGDKGNGLIAAAGLTYLGIAVSSISGCCRL